MKKGTIITIGRQCGSGGHEVGKKLAAKLGVPFYDKELLRLAAEQSGLAPENFDMYDEVPTSSLLYSLSLGNYGMAMGQYDMPIHQKIFLAQFDTIQKLADKGESCVIIGRCADYALAKREQVINVFLRADPKARVERLVQQYADLNAKKAADQMVKTDKRRAAYHNFYADTRWGSPDSYDLMIDCLKTGIDETVELLATYAALRFPD
ncbi:MAG: cytidylate kinase-like family protein [Ruminococcaceae bacterium]|nr:cytidylate kinase-like family protein [Oscillospiraceae bacterium]